MQLSAEVVPCDNRKNTAFIVFFLLLTGLFWLIPTLSHAFWPFSSSNQKAPVKVEKEVKNSGSASTELLSQIKSLADELDRNLVHADFQKSNLPHGLIVCTLVDLKKLYRTSSFGRYLSEQMMNAFQQRGYHVVELRKSTQVQIKEKYGEYGLSRDPEEIIPEVAAGAMMTGTYIDAADEVVVNVRIVDSRDGSMLSTASAVFSKNKLVAALLRDSSTASASKAEVTYMKRLEL